VVFYHTWWMFVLPHMVLACLTAYGGGVFYKNAYPFSI